MATSDIDIERDSLIRYQNNFKTLADNLIKLLESTKKEYHTSKDAADKEANLVSYVESIKKDVGKMKNDVDLLDEIKLEIHNVKADPDDIRKAVQDLNLKFANTAQSMTTTMDKILENIRGLSLGNVIDKSIKKEVDDDITLMEKSVMYYSTSVLNIQKTLLNNETDDDKKESIRKNINTMRQTVIRDYDTILGSLYASLKNESNEVEKVKLSNDIKSHQSQREKYQKEAGDAGNAQITKQTKITIGNTGMYGKQNMQPLVTKDKPLASNMQNNTHSLQTISNTIDVVIKEYNNKKMTAEAVMKNGGAVIEKELKTEIAQYNYAIETLQEIERDIKTRNVYTIDIKTKLETLLTIGDMNKSISVIIDEAEQSIPSVEINYLKTKIQELGQRKGGDTTPDKATTENLKKVTDALTDIAVEIQAFETNTLSYVTDKNVLDLNDVRPLLVNRTKKKYDAKKAIDSLKKQYRQDDAALFDKVSAAIKKHGRTLFGMVTNKWMLELEHRNIAGVLDINDKSIEQIDIDEYISNANMAIKYMEMSLELAKISHTYGMYVNDKDKEMTKSIIKEDNEKLKTFTDKAAKVVTEYNKIHGSNKALAADNKTLPTPIETEGASSSSVSSWTQVDLPPNKKDAPDVSEDSEEEATEPLILNEQGIEEPAKAAYITVRYFNSPWDCKDPGHRQEIMRYFVNNGKKYNGKVAHDLGDKELGKSWPKDEHKTPLDATFSYAKSLDDINQKIKESLDGDDINKNTNPEAYWKYVNEKIKCSEKLKAVRRRLEDEYQLEIAADDDRLRWTFEFWEFREGDNMTGHVWEVIEEQYKKDNIIILFEFSLPGKQERWFYLFKETDLLVECRRGTGFSMQINTHGKEKFKILLWSDPDMMIVLKSRQVSYISIKVYEVVKLNVEGGKSDGNLAAASKNDHDVVNKDIIPVEENSNPPVIPNKGANLEKKDSSEKPINGSSTSSNINDLPIKGNGSINRSTVRPQKKRRLNVKEIGINIDEFMSK